MQISAKISDNDDNSIKFVLKIIDPTVGKRNLYFIRRNIITTHYNNIMANVFEIYTIYNIYIYNFEVLGRRETIPTICRRTIIGSRNLGSLNSSLPPQCLPKKLKKSFLCLFSKTGKYFGYNISTIFFFVFRDRHQKRQ